MHEGTIHEPARTTPVVEESDICVLGGSCTGVFAAVRAARLGARVTLVEKHNGFGGAATNGLVSIWHSLWDTGFKRQIIAGLTHEVVDRLKRRNAVQDTGRERDAFRLNTEELKIELDELVTESGVIPRLHTLYVAPFVSEGRLDAVIVEDKSGRAAIRAKVFIDATGDGDLCAHLGLPFDLPPTLQPPTACMKLHGWDSLPGFHLDEAIERCRSEYHLPEDWGWRTTIPGLAGLYMHADNHVFGVDPLDAASLTRAELEGRRTNRAIVDIIRRHCPPGHHVTLVDLAACLGIRESRHMHCAYRLTEQDVLGGKRFDDAIANGSYRVDIHHEEKPGLTFRYLDGTEVYIRRGHPNQAGRWREETAENPTFYQIPYRALVPGRYPNLLLAGRMLDADKGAYGAVRVMVNLNQTGEAAGVAACECLSSDAPAGELDVNRIRKLLAEGGSIVI